ncbi:MAG TPA: chorismate mutase [Solirubrobacteraceae bacterium]|nr:chorismate mutase [Solirubrobacteraceae bacterium]
MRLFALRGATSVKANDAGAIRDATAELMAAIMARNGLEQDAVVSCLFTATDDLDAEFPAAAARAAGFSAVPLICAREIAVPGSMPRVVRVLMHYHAAEDHSPVHVYLHEASALRSDLAGAQ